VVLLQEARQVMRSIMLESPHFSSPTIEGIKDTVKKGIQGV